MPKPISHLPNPDQRSDYSSFAASRTVTISRWPVPSNLVATAARLHPRLYPENPMKRAEAFLFVLIFCCTSAIAAERPNILVVVADDLGYADIGVHGGNAVPTPHIDALAASGIRCTN